MSLQFCSMKFRTKRMKSFFITALVLLSLTNVNAQSSFRLSGKIKDAGTGILIPDASVKVKPLNIETHSDSLGNYRLSLEAGDYEISVVAQYYQEVKFNLKVNKDTLVNFKLDEKVQDFNRASVQGRNKVSNVRSTELGVSRLNIKQIQKMPALLGEVDVIRSLQTLPGVSTVGEGASGFNVRGGNIDQNLILMDEVPVFNSSHLFGMFSIFNPDVVKDLTLLKGSMPAQYGGRVSSVLDVKTKDGNKNKTEFNGGIGTVFSRFSIDGPLLNNKLSYVLAVRRSYLDVVAKPFVKGDMKDTRFNFYDVNAKLNWKINKFNSISLSAYRGKDIFGSDFRFDYGNSLFSLNWITSKNKLALRTNAYLSDYNFLLDFATNGFKFGWVAGIKSRSLKSDLTYTHATGNIWKFGLQSIYSTFNPGDGKYSSLEDFSTNIKLPLQNSVESAIYFGNERKLNDKLNLYYGLRWSIYNYVGNGYAYTFKDSAPNSRKRLLEEKYYSKFQNIQSYNIPEPRLAVNYMIDKNNSLKFSYTKASQYLQIVSNTAASSPLDIYMPATNNIKPLISNQTSLGYYANFLNNTIETSAEVYYKSSENQLDYIDNSNFYLNKYIEADLMQGQGRSYGLELFLKKNTGRMTGWLSYTFSRAERKVNGLSNNEWYLSKHDRTNNLNLVVMYDINKRLTLSGNFVYQSGTPATFPDSKMSVQGYYFPENTTNKRGNYRISAYHRLDVGMTYHFKSNEKKKLQRNLVISIYNLYNRHNAFSVYVRNNPNSTNLVSNEAIRYSIIGSFVPAITYNVKF